jgi:heptaprenyl diphosphate synthase
MPIEANFDEQLKLVNEWLCEYVSVSDPRVGRSGPVCPFMPRALKQLAVQTRIRPDIDGLAEPELIDALLAEVGDFGKCGRPDSSSGVVLDSRIIVMPAMTSAGWRNLDASYPHLKRAAVESGKMVGIFHPECDDRAVRNNDFRVSVAPIAMLAIRYMAPHDILFLGDSIEWFKEYDSRFGERFAKNHVRDSLLIDLYSTAREKYGASV